MQYTSVRELVLLAEHTGQSMGQLVLQDQSKQGETDPQILFDTMKQTLQVMKQSVESGLDPDKRSISGLTGGDAYKMHQAVTQGRNICGSVFGNALTKALATSQTNACMGKIVAAPTAGSCGILPAAILTMAQERNLDDDALTYALFSASGIGLVIANCASISGAEGGCQAECGAASAMAAAALVELCGGTPRQMEHACAIALKNVLGLVCDPVAGLVEIPCIKRNAAGVANALVAAELALAGIESAIPADEVIWAMDKVGKAMSTAFKETAEGGLAITPTGKKLCAQVFGEHCGK